MIPPTPTPLGPGSSIFDVPVAYTLWGGAPTAIQVWNWIGVWQVILQLLFILVLVLVGMVMFTKFLNSMSAKDSEE